MIEENPYASPNTSSEKPILKAQYESRKEAIVAGLKNGAKFGGKWMAIPLILLAVITWITLLAFVLYGCIKKGLDFNAFFKKFDLIEGIWLTTISIVYPTLIGASFGALIMGIGGGIAYGNSKKKDDEMKLNQNDSPMESGNE